MAYVGKTNYSLRERWDGHLRASRGKGGCRKLNEAIRKYGSFSFVLTVLTRARVGPELAAAEGYWIEYFNTIKDGYNCVGRAR